MSSTRSSTIPASTLPRQLDPRKFAQQGVNISGEVDLKALDRLCPLLASDQGKISANLLFGIDDQGIRNVTGVINAELEMVCQRCLEPAVQSLELSINLGIVWDDEQAGNLSKLWDPWVLDEGQTDIYQMIEDELILGLPIVAYHPTNCVAHDLYSATADSEQDALSADELQSLESEKPNPFQMLEELKGSLKKASDEVPESSHSDEKKH